MNAGVTAKEKRAAHRGGPPDTDGERLCPVYDKKFLRKSIWCAHPQREGHEGGVTGDEDKLGVKSDTKGEKTRYWFQGGQPTFRGLPGSRAEGGAKKCPARGEGLKGEGKKLIWGILRMARQSSEETPRAFIWVWKDRGKFSFTRING